MNISPIQAAFERAFEKSARKVSVITPKKTLSSDVFVLSKAHKFTKLNYLKSKSIEDAALFAEKNFGVRTFEIQDLSDANLLNATFTRIYNMTKGKAKFPPIIYVYKQKNARYSGGCGVMHIELVKTKHLADDIIHEIGHYNHDAFCKNYYKMGKMQELIDDDIHDFSIFETFKNDKKSLKLIKKYISPYATSSPAEFIACTFNAIINCRKLPPEIYEFYKKYEGPFFR